MAVPQAYGVMLHEIATYGKLPYAGIKNKDVAKHILGVSRCHLACTPLSFPLTVAVAAG